MKPRWIIALAFLLTSCWSGYAGRASVHAEVLTSMATKLVGVIEAGRPPKMEDMGEYVYPAKRAREFLESYDSHADYQSYRQLNDLIARYEALVQRVDADRAAGTDWAKVIDELRAENEAIRRLAADIDRSLEART